MRLPVPFIRLPLLFDAGFLSNEISSLRQDVWRKHPQEFPGNSMLPLIAVGGDPLDESFDGKMAPTPWLLACPYLMQVLASLDTTLGRTRLMRLAGQAEVTPHIDHGYYWAERVRVHVPVVTQPSVRFICDGASINMAAGECWIFDTSRMHSVVNDASLSRTHLVVDTVGSGRFWDLIRAGRPHDASLGGWNPRYVEPTSGAPDLRCEQYNIPRVMSPWEVNFHLRTLLSDVPQQCPQLRLAYMLVERFVREWRGLWACHGDSGSGEEAYVHALEDFMEALPEEVAQMPLRNGTPWMDGALALVGKVAVKADAETSRRNDNG